MMKNIFAILLLLAVTLCLLDYAEAWGYYGGYNPYGYGGYGGYGGGYGWRRRMMMRSMMYPYGGYGYYGK